MEFFNAEGIRQQRRVPKSLAEWDHIACYSEASTRKHLENEGRGEEKPLPPPKPGISFVHRDLIEFYSVIYFSLTGFIFSEHYLGSRPWFTLSLNQRSNSKARREVPHLPQCQEPLISFSPPLFFTPLTPFYTEILKENQLKLFYLANKSLFQRQTTAMNATQ